MVVVDVVEVVVVVVVDVVVVVVVVVVETMQKVWHSPGHCLISVSNTSISHNLAPRVAHTSGSSTPLQVAACAVLAFARTAAAPKTSAQRDANILRSSPKERTMNVDRGVFIIIKKREERGKKRIFNLVSHGSCF